jgi:hypothetical protein
MLRGHNNTRDAVYRTLIVVLLFARKRPVVNLSSYSTSRDHQAQGKITKKEREKRRTKNMSRTREFHSTALVMDR